MVINGNLITLVIFSIISLVVLIFVSKKVLKMLKGNQSAVSV